MKFHELKTDPAPFEAIVAGNKTFEIRRNDRGFAVGDILVLFKTTRKGQDIAEGAELAYAGKVATVKITHGLLSAAYGLVTGFAILSITRPSPLGSLVPYMWREYARYPKEAWQAAVAAEDTHSGYWDWVDLKLRNAENIYGGIPDPSGLG